MGTLSQMLSKDLAGKSDIKPIYEIWLPSHSSNEEVELVRRSFQKMSDEYNVVVVKGHKNHYMTNMHYPKPSFWGFMYKLFRLR